MFESPLLNLSHVQAERLRRFDVARSVDIHCHCLPGVDDGPASLDDAIQMCHALVEDGITDVIATPHQMGRFEGRNSPADIRTAVKSLQATLIKNGIPLRVSAGGDVRVDHRLTSLVDADEVCTLADTKRYLLLELPHETYIDLKHIITIFTERRCTLIVSHPERHAVLSRKPEATVPWLEAGAVLQVTGGSLLGDFGATAEASAWRWLEMGQVALIATDAHGATGRAPTMTAAIEKITARVGEKTAKRICLENPLRVLAGESLLPVERSRRARRWGW